MRDRVEIVEALDPVAEYGTLLEVAAGSSGALVCFTGLVRDFNLQASVNALFIEHYPGMTEKCLHEIIAEARGRWELDHCVIIHRVGEMTPADPIVFVGVSSAHRAEAFAAGEFIMDYLKTRAPFWKKETGADSKAAKWLDSRQEDAERAKRW